VKINSERHYLWRAADHEGAVLESFVTKTRDRKAVLKFLKKSIKRRGRPAGNGSLAEQQGAEFAPAISMTGAGDAALPGHAKFAEIRVRPCLRP
jgi:hypothetical protein